MQHVAETVGVQAPSLYKHVPSRSALIRLVAEDLVADIGRQLDAAANTGDPRTDLRALATTLRAFAHRDPHSFDLIFATTPSDATPNSATLTAATAPILRATTQLTGPKNALNAARTLTAWASGFLRMELSGEFHLDGDVSQAFEFGLQSLITGLEHQA